MFGGRVAVLKKPWWWWLAAWSLFAAFLIGLFGLVGLQITLAAQNHPFTAFETTVLAAGQLLMGTAVSSFLSWLFTKLGFEAEHQRFSLAAVRRVVGFKESVARLRKAISDRRQGISHGVNNPLVVYEYLNHFDSLAAELDSQASKSIEDWADISGVSLSSISIIGALESAKAEAEAKVEQLSKEVKRIDELAGEKDAEQAALKARYEEEIADLKKRAIDAASAALSLGRLPEVRIDLNHSRGHNWIQLALLDKLRKQQSEVNSWLQAASTVEESVAPIPAVPSNEGPKAPPMQDKGETHDTLEG